MRVGYVGTKGTHLKTEYDQNAPIYNPNLTLTQNRANIDERRPVEDFQTISRWMHGLNSSYHALQVSVDKRYSQGFTVSASYTWSKNLDYRFAQWVRRQPRHQQSVQFLLLARKLRLTRTIGSSIPSSGTCPNTKIHRGNAILGNWRLSGIISLQSGRPFTIGASNNPTPAPDRRART